MPDYTPVYQAGNVISATAAGTLTGGDPVEVAGNGTVQRCQAANSPKYLGIAAQDSATGARVTIIPCSPVHEGAADGGVTAGDQLAPSSTAGRQVKSIGAALPVNVDVGAAFNQAAINAAINAVAAGVNANRAFCGIALTTAIDGATVRWMQK